MIVDFLVFKTILLVSVFLMTVVGISFYKKLAVKFNIVAKKNFRTLHETEVPKGSGIVFSISYLLALSIGFFVHLVPGHLALPLLLGGIAATVFGFVDDVSDLNPKLKLIVQVLLSTFIVIWFQGIHICYHVNEEPVSLGLWSDLVGILFITWFINAYNFMDGIDGMAASGSVFISVLISIITLIHGYAEFSLITLLLSFSCLAFLLYNWPPARIFMGDSGSVFLGYTFPVLIIYSMQQGYITIWTWIIAFSYFGFDTGVTLITRILLVKKWYGAHRSHAYQNLARIWGSHIKVLNIVNIFHLIWVLPLAMMSVFYEELQVYLTVFAVLPVIVWTLKYGPPLSSD